MLCFDNLEIISRRERQRRARTPSHNTSGVRGVSARGDGKKFIAHIHDDDGKVIHLGNFDNIEDAAAARDRAVEEYYNA